METKPLCQRQYLKCKIYAEGRINGRLVCRNCLEKGEATEFELFEK